MTPGRSLAFSCLSRLIRVDVACLMTYFDGRLVNNPEFPMDGTIATSGRVEITSFTGPSCVVIIRELKYQFPGDDTKAIAQMLVEA